MFQDEELLFSQSQQKDNDPDVDLFSTPGKAAVSINANIYLYLPFLGVYDYILFFHCIISIHFMTVVFLELQDELHSEASSTQSVFR